MQNANRVLDFLARSTRESNIQEMSKAQALATFSLFLERFSNTKYDAMVS